MTLAETVYRGATRAARRVAPLLSAGGSKLARSLRGRREAADRLSAWGRRERDTGRSLIWLHAPSVGEGLQARAVLDGLRDLRPDVQAIFTHTSPSAEGLARSMGVEAADYLPWDVQDEVRRVLDDVRPDLVAFTKTEIWPVLVAAAARRGVPTVLHAATLPEGSSRLRWPARSVLVPGFARLDAVLAIADDDAERFRRLGARPDRVEVTGDPGIDSAARRAQAADPDAPYLRPFRDGGPPFLVAGSTWPPDEAVLVPGCTAVRDEGPGLRLIVAPHEPDEAHLEPLERELGEAGWRTARLGEVEEAGGLGGADAVVVDRVGVLAALYTVGAMAYVGGGFHGDGLHSVLEPAAAGLPVLFGPRHHNARAADELIEVGGARVVLDQRDVADAVRGWLREPEIRGHWGRAASGYIHAHRGAARRTAERLSGFLPGDRPTDAGS